jgi:translation initiation factor IF-3
MDFGRYQYQEQKRARQAKKHQKIIEVKEIKFRPKVDEHDYQFKKKHIERFLADGDKVKATIFFRGREMAHPEIGRRILERLIEDLTEVAIAETAPRQEGNQMHTILSARAGAKRTAPKPPRESRHQRPARRRETTDEGRRREKHAETEDTSARAKRFKKTGPGSSSGQRVQAPHPHSKTRSRKSASVRGTLSWPTPISEAAQDDAELSCQSPASSSSKAGAGHWKLETGSFQDTTNA